MLTLKENVKVMIVWNVSDQLKNGTTGTFIGEKDGLLEVDVPGYGVHHIKRETWTNRDRNGNTIGCRTHFPLVLF